MPKVLISLKLHRNWIKFVTTFLLTTSLLLLGSGLTAFGQFLLFPEKLVISSSDLSSFIPKATDPKVMFQYLLGDGSGATSIRFEKNKLVTDNPYPIDSLTVYGNRSVYGYTYQQRDRDLGQTFLTGSRGFNLDAVYLRVGPNEVKPNAAGARVAIQFFKIDGKPRLNNHGTPGFVGQFDRQNSPELDDYLEGEVYTPIYLATGNLPGNLQKNQYMKWQLVGKPLRLNPYSNYAFMVMFLDREQERSLSLYNNYYGKYRPDWQNPYVGHGIRREGKSDFPNQWEQRLSLKPGTLGFPDVCTFRDLFFVITAK